MGQSYTEVYVDGEAAYGTYGHADPDRVITDMREHWQRERARAEKYLAGIDAGEVEVYHQQGIYAVRNRRKVN